LLKIDHVLMACKNLYVTADEFRDQTGLNFYEGGYFKGFGIAQKLVPLGNQQYLEIESVVDVQEAEECEWDIARSMMSRKERRRGRPGVVHHRKLTRVRSLDR
jgi:hypothetical protein